MLEVDDTLVIPADELRFSAIRAQGAGGQNVNKVSSAMHLRFDSQRSAVLDATLKARLLELRDRRIGPDGIIVIKAQRYRTQEQNRRDALRRLQGLLLKAKHKPKPRKPTRPSRRQREQRLQDKAHRAQVKSRRGPVHD